MNDRPKPDGNGRGGRDKQIGDTSILSDLVRVCTASEYSALNLATRAQRRRTRRTALMATNAYALAVDARALLILLCSDLIHEIDGDEPDEMGGAS